MVEIITKANGVYNQWLLFRLIVTLLPRLNFFNGGQGRSPQKATGHTQIRCG
ncbi:hypothetical protein SAMN03080601_03598 [Alkalitalea saponilacus]|uniref:Uncharacterized protein n=1 Tax=Alkalitalea saponilacus TaxID=889453 RepID=A0A1T5HUD4_9BACT|nr:hypothetical protein SAMN03080601_03598 [Alkalitalea saponilacus]